MLRKSLVLLILLFVSSHLSSAEHTEHQQAPAKQRQIQLSPPLQEALTQEMISIQNTMMQMLPSIAAGEWDRVAQLAKKIEGAYIMRQKLSPTQMEELHRTLPPAFVAQDHSFHQMAGMLAHVAEEPHVELVSFYYYKLTEACIGCHSRFATTRFPHLAKPAQMHRDEPQNQPMQNPEQMHNPEHHH